MKTRKAGGHNLRWLPVRSFYNPFPLRPNKWLAFHQQSMKKVIVTPWLYHGVRQRQCVVIPDCVTLHESILADWVPSRSVVSDSLQPQGLQPARLLCPWGCSRQEYWHGLPALLQGIFPIQGSNPGLPHCEQILHRLSHEGSPLSGLELEKFTFYAWTSTLNCLWWGSRNRNRSGIQQWRLTPSDSPQLRISVLQV